MNNLGYLLNMEQVLLKKEIKLNLEKEKELDIKDFLLCLQNLMINTTYRNLISII